ncbi:uncharacterized protein [Haliotis cracherodii]|uniref:uncharacterized protein n=1 Tax=Haliotis cracherodii TaxID=6455 RepID=UPI0039EAF48B
MVATNLILLTTVSLMLAIITEQAPADQAAFPAIQVVVASNGTYQLKVKGTVWLNSAPTFFVLNNQRYGIDDGSLVVESVTNISFTGDLLGPGVETRITFNANNVTIVASVLAYSSDELLTFKVNFPMGATDINHFNYDKVICGFPGFVMENDLYPLGFMSLGGEFAGYTGQVVGRWNKTANIQDGLEGSAPLNLFDKSFNAITIGPQDNFMSTSLWRDIDNDYVYWGIMSGVTQVPTNFTYQVLTAYSADVTESMFVWGNSIASLYYRLSRPSDPVVNNIGYWTGEGSFYYEEGSFEGNYEDAITAVFAAAANRSLPYRYVELDNWWFTKGQGGGVKEWTAPTDIFPNGIEQLHNKINVPVVAKNNFWSSDTIYATQNQGQYNFDISGDMALPKDEAFWDFLFGEAKQWGMTTYIQDNMTEIFRQFDYLKMDLDYGRDWLMNMGTAATKHNITIQYSGALPRMVMQSLEIPAVTQIRVSPNYGASEDQWKIGLTSIFASGLQVAISKDGFLSQQHEGALGDPNSQRQGLISSLSKGMFETGDEAWKSNTTLIMKSCLKDGTILRPDFPVVAVDAQLMQRAFQDGSGPVGEVWATLSTVTRIGDGPELKFGIIFASNLQGSYAITPSTAGFTFEFPKSKIFNAKDPREQHDFSEDKPFTLTGCTADTFCLYYTSPVISLNNKEVLILGELDKWIPMSRQRVINVTLSNVITIDLVGAKQEKVEMWFSVNGNMGALAIDVNNNGAASLVFEDKLINSGGRGQPLSVVVAAAVALVVTFFCKQL